MAAKEGSAPSPKVSKTFVLLLHHSAISVARLSELSSVQPLCHTDQPPRKSASHMKEVPYDRSSHLRTHYSTLFGVCQYPTEKFFELFFVKEKSKVFVTGLFPSASLEQKFHERPRATAPAAGCFFSEGHEVVIYGQSCHNGFALIGYLYLGIVVVQFTRKQSGQQLPISEFFFHGIKIFPSCRTRQCRARIRLQNQTQEQAQLREWAK